MKFLFTSACKPLPVFLGRFLSIDDVSYRFIVDQGVFSATADVPCFSLHFLAQNLNVPSIVLEWPTFEELEAELQSDHYDYVCISFKGLDSLNVYEMTQRIRQVSPHTKIVLGGYGTLSFNEPDYAYIGKAADYVCNAGEGVRFLRNLIGDKEQRPMISHLPIEVIRVPWLTKAAGVSTKLGYMLSALGCHWKCEFCCTSAYAEGKVLDVMSAEELVESMKWYYRQHLDMKNIFMMDEELLLRHRKVNKIGELIRNDSEFGLTMMSYLAFGTLKAISTWEPEQLLMNGVAEVWTGVESLYSYDMKKGVDSRSLIKNLHAHGVESQLSWIVGDDCQNKENIEADVQFLMEHEPCTAQLSVLSASPGTALYARLKPAGRIRPFNPEESHLLGNNMDSLHFTHEERVDIILSTYRRMYEKLGPSVMRSLKVYMNGYEFCSKSQNPYLNTQKREYFRRRINSYVSLVKVATEFAPTAEVRKSMEDLYHRYVDLIGPFRKSQHIASDRFVKLAQEEMDRREREGYQTLRDVPLKRYEYNRAFQYA